MQTILKHLLDLQAVDVRLHDVRARLAAIPKQIAEVDSRVSAAHGELDKAKAAQIATLKDRKRFELDVEQWKEKARKYKDQLYEVKTNEAYKTLQHEIQMAETEMTKAEDRQLEQMVASEEYERKVKACERTVAEVDAVAKTERAKINAEKAAAEQELAKLNAERQQALAQVPEDLVDHYERIAKKHGGMALAEVRSEMCSQCGVRVRPHVMQELGRAGEGELLHCETCTRILYLLDGAESPAERTPLAQTNNG